MSTFAELKALFKEGLEKVEALEKKVMSAFDPTPSADAVPEQDAPVDALKAPEAEALPQDPSAEV